jgi:hypothetical protein
MEDNSRVCVGVHLLATVNSHAGRQLGSWSGCLRRKKTYISESQTSCTHGHLSSLMSGNDISQETADINER